jgi:hypothetical protein
LEVGSDVVEIRVVSEVLTVELDQRKDEEQPVPEVVNACVREVRNSSRKTPRTLEGNAPGAKVLKPELATFVVERPRKDDPAMSIDDEVVSEAHVGRVEHRHVGSHGGGRRARVARSEGYEFASGLEELELPRLRRSGKPLRCLRCRDHPSRQPEEPGRPGDCQGRGRNRLGRTLGLRSDPRPSVRQCRPLLHEPRHANASR